MQQPDDGGEDLTALFSGWESTAASTTASAPASRPAAASAGAVTSIQGLLVAVYDQGDRVRLQLRVPAVHAVQDTKSFWVPADTAAALEVLDEVRVECVERISAKGTVYLNPIAVERVTPWTQRDTTESVPMPLPVVGTGPLFVLRWAPVAINSAPGIHRKLVTWGLMPGGNDRRLEVTLVQRQWTTFAEAHTTQLLTVTLVIWNDQCLQLPGPGLTPDLALWKRVMPHHVVPFTAACRVNAKYCGPGKISLLIVAIQWELQAYVEDQCPELSLAAMQALFKRQARAAPAAPIVSITAMGELPPDPTHWRFYALCTPNTQEPATSNAIFVAVRHRPAAPTKRLKSTAE